MKKQGEVDHLPAHGAMCFCIFCVVFFLFISTRLIAHGFQEIGYDENTEITIKGKVVNASFVQVMGLECMLVKSKNCLFRVLIAPMWFIKQTGFSPRDGDAVEIRGSKFFGEDGAVYLLSRSIKFTPKGRVYILRDKECRPVWCAKGVGESSCLRIFYPTPSK
ncbi:MAG: hypothetical protein ACP5J5_04675 [Dissulfurimicrobium sp.]|uniref:hypothetical protein n=1 Tax=Dissulfurimicrobium TaxID=1769732 RepID=UPI001EDB1943|nr:hypothetical protein [Dissulfurimicrobium hydrothermale]UKL13020.1 hypothetical protein LGS26_05850 [Dissulfurimicrobium hydrothermale]